MNGDVEYLRGNLFAELTDPLDRFKQLEEQQMRDYKIGEVQGAAEESDYQAGQDMQARETEKQGMDNYLLMEAMGIAMEDKSITTQYKANLADAEARNRISRRYKEGVPTSIIAADKQYGDALRYDEIAGSFKDYLPEGSEQIVKTRAMQSRRALAESLQKNLGLREEEADEIITKRYGDVERNFSMAESMGLGEKPTSEADVPGISRKVMATLAEHEQKADLAGKKIISDVVASLQAQAEKSMATGPALRDMAVEGAEAVGGATQRFVQARADDAVWGVSHTAGFLAKTLLSTLEKFSIVDAPLLEAGMAMGNALVVSDAMFMERYPESAAQVARLEELGGMAQRTADEEKEFKALRKDLSEVDWLERLGVVAAEGGKAWGKEAWRIIRGGEYDTTHLDRFAANLTDDPSKQAIIKTIMPFVSIVPILGWEASAAKLARKAPHLFQRTAVGNVLDVLVPGRPTSWLPNTEVMKVATASAIERSARTKLVTDYGEVSKAAEAEGTGAYEKTILDFTEDLLKGDFSKAETREMGWDIVARGNNAADATPQDKAALNLLELRLKEAEDAAANPSMPNREVVFKGSDDAHVEQRIADVVAEMEAWPDYKGMTENKNFASVSETGIGYNPAMTRDEVIASERGLLKGTLEMLGVHPSVFEKIIGTDAEAKLFVLLHEKGHWLAKHDFHNPLDRTADKSIKAAGGYPDYAKSKELAAGIYALDEFTRLTGKPFYMFDSDWVVGPKRVMKVDERTGRMTFEDVDLPPVNPGSFTVFNPQTGAFELRMIPQVAFGKAAPDEVRMTFQQIGGNARDFPSVAKSLALRGAAQPGALKFAPPSGNPLTAYQEQWENTARFGALGEIFGLTQKLEESAFMFGERVLTYFTYRFGQTDDGFKNFPDGQKEYADFGAEVMAKAEELHHAWLATKKAAALAKGTVMEDQVNHFAVWFKSYASNGGNFYESVRARTMTWNRELKAKKTEEKWHGGGAAARAEAEADRVAGQKGQTEMYAQEDLKVPHGVGGRVAGGFHEPEKGAPIPSNQAHGAQGDALDTWPLEQNPEDAMWNAGRETVDEADSGVQATEASAIAEEDLPLDLSKRSLESTPENIKVAELELFADGSTVSSPVAGGRVNIWLATAKDFNTTFAELTKTPLGQAQVETITKRLIDGQLKHMAEEVAQFGADIYELVTFHRGMAVAKAMLDIRHEGKVLDTTTQWLNEMDFRAGAVGETIDQRILTGLGRVADEYGFAFNVQKDGQRVLDTNMVERFHNLPDSEMARTMFIDEYAKMWTGPEMVKSRREVNAARKKIAQLVGGPCLGRK